MRAQQEIAKQVQIMRMAAAAVAAPVALTVSDKVEMTAQVTFAARLPARAITKAIP